MSDTSNIDPISAKLQSEERRRLRGMVLFTLIPLMAAVVLIWVSAEEVKELEETQAALQVAKDSLLLIDEQRIEQLYEVDSLETVKDSLFNVLHAINSQIAQQTTDQAQAAYMTIQQVPRVFIHIMDDRQRDAATRLQRQLEKAGYNVPGIEEVEWRSQTSELRVFREEDLETAHEIQDAIEARGLQISLKDVTARYAKSTAIRSGHLEIWLGANVGR